MSWAAIAGSVISTGLSVGSQALMGGMGGGGASLPNYNRTFTPIPNVPYDPQQGARDLASNVGILKGVAKQMTKHRTQQREEIMPGAGAQMQLGSQNILSFLRGQVPQDSQDLVMRQAAERLGGGFNAATGGGQLPQNYARNLGLTSLDLIRQGLSASPSWQQLANSFVIGIEDTVPMALGFANQRYQYDAMNTGIDQFNQQGMMAQETGAYQTGMNAYTAGQLQNQSQTQGLLNLAQFGLSAASAFGDMSNIYQNRLSTNRAQRPTEYLSSGQGWVPDAGVTGNFNRAQKDPSFQSNVGLLGNPFKSGRR